MRIMYDAVTPENIPHDAGMVAGYVNGKYQSYYELAKLFPNAIHVSIAVSADADAQVLDCERFDATPEECPAWAARQRQRGQAPTVYMNASTWPAVRSAFVAQHVPEPEYWVANYDGVAEIPAGSVAKQYAGGMTAGYDVSAVLDYWPGVDPIPNGEPELNAAEHQMLIDLHNRVAKFDAEAWNIDGDAHNPGVRQLLATIIQQNTEILAALQRLTP